jgi:hypothetical protein
MIGVNRDLVGNRLQHMFPFLKRCNYGKHFLIVDIIVDFRRFELTRIVGYWVQSRSFLNL